MTKQTKTAIVLYLVGMTSLFVASGITIAVAATILAG